MTARARVIVITFSVAILLTALSALGFLAAVTEPVRQTLGPATSAISRASSNAVQRLRGLSLWSVARENQLLRSQIQALERENSMLATRSQESRALSNLTNTLASVELPVTIARVLTRSADPAAQLLTIDRGTTNSVSNGDAVLSDAGFLLGRVRTVRAHTSDVLVVTDPTSRITVTVLNGPDPLGVLVGDRGLLARLTSVARESVIEIGQSVVTAGIDDGVPRGLPVGSITDVTTKPVDLFQSGTVVLPAQLDRQIIVAVVTLKR